MRCELMIEFDWKKPPYFSIVDIDWITPIKEKAKKDKIEALLKLNMTEDAANIFLPEEA